MPTDTLDLKHALSHVLWIGGPPDSGKTSIADLLAEKYGMQVYHFDRHEPAHFARHDPIQHPALHAASPEMMTAEQRWVTQSPEEMAAGTIASWSERVEMAIVDLLAMPRRPRIVAEGPGFFPECITPLIADPHQAAWLVPSESFKRDSVARRGKPGARLQTSDPERATRNLVGRDLLMGKHVLDEARRLGLTVIEVDGARDLHEIFTLVEAHFAPYLPSARS